MAEPVPYTPAAPGAFSPQLPGQPAPAQGQPGFGGSFAPGLGFDPLSGINARLNQTPGASPQPAPQPQQQQSAPASPSMRSIGEDAANNFLLGRGRQLPPAGPAGDGAFDPETGAGFVPTPQNAFGRWSDRQFNSLNDWVLGGQQEAKDLAGSSSPREFLGRAWDALPNDPKLPNTYRDYAATAASLGPFKELGGAIDRAGESIDPETYGIVKDMGRGLGQNIGNSLERSGDYRAARTAVNAIGDKRPSLSDIYVAKSLAQRGGAIGAGSVGKSGPMLTRPGAAAPTGPGLLSRAADSVPAQLANQYSKIDPLTGVGAIRNFAGGVANVGRGVGEVLTGIGGRGPGISGGMKRIGSGMVQGGLVAPAQMTGPMVASNVAMGTRGEQADNRTNRYLSSLQQFGPAGPMMAVPEMLAKSFGVGRENTPTMLEAAKEHGGNLQSLFGLARDNYPAFEREVGYGLGDLGRNFNFVSGRPKLEYDQATKDYHDIMSSGPSGLGGLLGKGKQLEDLRNRVHGMNYESPTGPDMALRGLLRDETANRLGQMSGADPASRELSLARSMHGDLVDNESLKHHASLPFPTHRDQLRGRVMAGMEPGPTASQHSGNFGSAVDQQVGQFRNLAAMQQSQAQPQPELNPAVQKQVQDILAAAPPEIGEGAGSIAAPQQVGQNVKSFIEQAGDLTNSLSQVEQMPPPDRGPLGQYWHSLPSGSKILAIAGLSITAISALRSMFGGDDGDEEGFLSRVLPYLGLGAAAWGLGGGTIGLERENLPAMQKYKDLGNAVGAQFGSGQLFN